MKKQHTQLIIEIISNINYITNDRTIYEPFIDGIIEDWKNVSFSITRLIILFSRHLLQNLMIKNLSDWYVSNLKINKDEISYSHIYQNIIPGIDNLELANNCLSVAHKLDPNNMYVMILKGMIFEEKKEYLIAKKWYIDSANADGYLSGLCYWLAARVSDKFGNTQEASELYIKSENTTNLKEIELIYYARNSIANNLFEKGFELYSRSLEYRWQSLNELFFDLKVPPAPIKIEASKIEKIEKNNLIFPKILFYNTDIYLFKERYYLVPDKIKEISSLDLSSQGLIYNQFLSINKLLIYLNSIFPRLFDKLSNRYNRLLKINRLYLRSLILSSNSLDDLLSNNSFRYSSKANNILIDHFNINYQIYYFLDKYYAVPLEIIDFQFRDLYLENLVSREANFIAYFFARTYNLFRIIRRFPFPKKYNDKIIKLNRLILTKKIVSGNEIIELVNKFEFSRFN